MVKLESIKAMNDYRSSVDCSIGFVPTMGALHAGHLSLITAAQEDNAVTIVSIFVNPTQFDNSADLDQYPNTLKQDLLQLEAMGVDAVFLPKIDSIYPDNYMYSISENDLSRQYCGAHRPGHFDGVLSVVLKLFNIIRADRAYFGEKDYQQLSLVKGMVEAFFLPVTIMACPIVREPDGLAMSSRNVRLSPIQRKIAPMLYQTLLEDSPVENKVNRLESLGFDVDYISVLGDRLLAAVTLGEIRLIDNVNYQYDVRSKA